MKGEIQQWIKIQWAHSLDINLKIAVDKTVINAKWKKKSEFPK